MKIFFTSGHIFLTKRATAESMKTLTRMVSWKLNIEQDEWKRVRCNQAAQIDIYRVVQKKWTVLLSNSLAWTAVAGCSRAETFSQLSSISFPQPCIAAFCLKVRVWLIKHIHLYVNFLTLGRSLTSLLQTDHITTQQCARCFLTSSRVRTGMSKGNQIHSSNLWTLGIPKMYMGPLSYNIQISH